MTNTPKKFMYFLHTLVYGDTRPTRLMVAIINLLMMVYIHNPIANDDMRILIEYPEFNIILLFQMLLCVNAVALILGLAGKFSYNSLILEGFLAFIIWGTISVTSTAVQGFLAPSSAVFLAVIWICARYPTHFRRKND